MEYNLNLSHCIKQASSFGYDTFYNICKGTSSVVPWGSIDWLTGISGLIVGSVFVGLIVTAAGMIAGAVYLMHKEITLT